MNRPMYILDINTDYHEFSTCLIKDGQLIAAVSWGFARIKHGKPALIDNPKVIPLRIDQASDLFFVIFRKHT